MIVGLPRETKPGERRVGLLPDAVRALVEAGHAVRVERGAGAGIGLGDDAYRVAGAVLTDTRGAWEAELVVKVKEMQDADFAAAPPRRTIFSFHHLPREPERTRALAARGDTAIAFEMLRDAAGTFPMLAPMSRIAGRLAMEQACAALARAPGRVVVLGAGHAGLAAARRAREAGAQVTVLTRSAGSCAAARGEGFTAALADPEAIARETAAADVVVGSVFVAGEPTPKLLSREAVRRMQAGAVIVDISIDAGGVAETSRPTTLAQPSYVAEGVIHFAVPNLPASVPVEAAAALSAAALPWVQRLAAHGVARAVAESPAVAEAVLVWEGRVTHSGIAAEAGLPYTALSPETAA